MSRYYWTKISKEPKKYDDYLVTLKSGVVDSAHFNGKWHNSRYWEADPSHFAYWRHYPNGPNSAMERIRDIVEWILTPFAVVAGSIALALFLMYDIFKNGNKY
jgi:hypothetical protein